MGRDDLSRYRIALVVNPASGRGRAAGLVDTVTAYLRRAADVDVRAGHSAAESAALLADCVDRFDAVVVLGGDGMVHLAVQALAQTATPLGVIAGGTGNDAATVLGLPLDPMAAAQAVLDALERAGGDTDRLPRVDLGRTSTGRWWFGVLYCGFDSAANARADRMRWPRGPRRYDLAIVGELLRLRTWPLEISLDGRELRVDATLVAIGNAPAYGGGKQIAPHADPRDGRFGITVVGPVSRLTLARLAPTLPRAGHIGHPAVTTYEASTVTLAGSGAVAYADGEPIGPLPVTTTCVASALRVLAPVPRLKATLG
jgi:diacylglycerol kinase (ATP)